jgi:hypothetical protein
MFARGTAADFLKTPKDELAARMTREQIAG